jgi:hypothetical protein
MGKSSSITEKSSSPRHGGKRPGTGGKRPGAGRKRGSMDRLTALKKAGELNLLPRSAAAEAVKAADILASVDEKALWQKWLKDEKRGLEALMYLTDRRDGRPRQAVEVSDPDGERPPAPVFTVNFIKPPGQDGAGSQACPQLRAKET